MWVRDRYVAALGVGALLAVGGCTGGEDPPVTPSTGTGAGTSSTTPSPTSSSPSTTTTTAAADIPAAARKHTPEGAEAFVKYYINQLNEAWTGPDAKRLPPLSDPGCIACKSLQSTAVALEKDGQRYVKSPVTVTKVAALDENADGVQLVRLFMDQHKVDVVDATGKVVLTDPEKKLARTVGAVWKGESWLLYDME